MNDHSLDQDETLIPDDNIIEGEILGSDDSMLPDDETYPLNPHQDEAASTESDIDEDVIRTIRSQRTRQKSSSRVAIFPLAMGFIGLGGLLIAQDYVDELEITFAASTIILLGSLILTYLFRFFTSRRRERGLFFLAMLTITWGSLIALAVVDGETYPIVEFWPLFFAGVGVSFFFTFIFERSHQVGLVFPGVILLFVSGIAFLVTLDVIEQETQELVGDYWPLLLAFVGLTLLPSALQEE